MKLSRNYQPIISVALVLFICSASLKVWPATQTVVIPHTMTDNVIYEGYYFTHLLDLAFSKTESEFGSVKIKMYPEWKAEKRLRTELKNNQLDLLWSPTSTELETEFIPIKISLLKELNDYHLLLIRPESQSNFLQVTDLKGLSHYVGGTGSQWRDAGIFDANQLPTVTAVGYDIIFRMLAAKRFDYFSRGIYQVKAEVDFYSALNLVIEKKLMLYYKNEVYFFVSKKKPELAKRLEQGLSIAIKDGSFDELFNSIPRYQWAMNELKNNHRLLIELK